MDLQHCCKLIEDIPKRLRAVRHRKVLPLNIELLIVIIYRNWAIMFFN